MSLRAWWRRFWGSDLRGELRSIAASVRLVPLEEAASQVEEALTHADKFRVAGTHEGTAAIPRELPASVHRLLTRYSSINTRYSDVTISRALVAPSQLLAGCIRIGDDGGHWEILVRPREDPVYVWDGGGGDPFHDPYPSVYHYLLEIIATVHPELVRLPDRR
jgi:hypothetical protein